MNFDDNNKHIIDYAWLKDSIGNYVWTLTIIDDE